MAAAAPIPAPVAGGYAVARPGGVCAVTQQPIGPGEKFMAVLRETPQGFERVDVSQAAWPDYDHASALGFWQATMPTPNEAKKKRFVDDEVLCQLFERLGDATEPAKINFRFVLGLILMRKRLLQYESTAHDESLAEIWTMRFRGRDETLPLVNPHLREEQIAEVSGQLDQVLNEGA